MSEALQELDDLWRNGHLRALEEDLDLFIQANLGEIRAVMREGKASALVVARQRYTRGEINDRQLVDLCVREVLRRRGSCNPRKDIEEQRGEIEREVWYEGERGRQPVPADRREEIARSWARRHAPRWREWRLYQLLYVWDKKVDQYLSLLSPRPEPPARSSGN